MNFKMLGKNYFQPRILPICKLLIKRGIETRHFQIYKAAKILPLMHIFLGSHSRMCFTKIKEGKTRKHGIEKKGGYNPEQNPQENGRKYRTKLWP